VDPNSRLPSLTGLRWAAALIVFGQHLLEQYYNPQLVAAKPVRSVVWAALAHGGGLGVSFFFVLSGFVLAWSARPGERAGTFWWRRFSKVYPATLVTTAVAALLIGGAGPLQLATHLTLTQSWVPRHDVYTALNLVSWSLSCEAFFYLCFPLLLAGMRRLGPAGLWAIAVMMVECVVAVGANLIPAPHSTAAYVGYVLPPVRMAEFTLGVAVALLVRTGSWRGPGLRWSLALLPPAMVAALFVPYPLNEHAVTLIPATLIVAAAARADLRGQRTLWSRPLTVYLGQLSFAFYLVHFLVIAAFDRYGLLPHQAGPAQALAATASVLWFSLIAAMVVYHGVELPALRLLRRKPTTVAMGPGRHRLMLTSAPAPRFVGSVPMPRSALASMSAPDHTATDPGHTVPAPRRAEPDPRPAAPAPGPAVPGPHLAVPEPRRAPAVRQRRRDVPVRHDAVPNPNSAVPDPDRAVPDSSPAVPEPDYAVPGLGHAVPDLDVAVPGLGHAVPEPDYAVPGLGHAVPDLDVAVPGLGHAVPEPDYVVPDLRHVVPEPRHASIDRHAAREPRHGVPARHHAVPDLDSAEPDFEPAGPDHAGPDFESAGPDHAVPEPRHASARRHAVPDPHYAVTEHRNSRSARHYAVPEPRHEVSAQHYATRSPRHSVPGRHHAVPEPRHAVPDPIHVAPDPIHVAPDPVHAAPDPVHAAPDLVHAAPEPTHPVAEPISLAAEAIHLVAEPIHELQEPRHAIPGPRHAVPEPRHGASVDRTPSIPGEDLSGY
jgi:peptidoglycan/LPS O-acetylase OafA/YrhL